MHMYQNHWASVEREAQSDITTFQWVENVPGSQSLCFALIFRVAHDNTQPLHSFLIPYLIIIIDRLETKIQPAVIMGKSPT